MHDALVEATRPFTIGCSHLTEKYNLKAASTSFIPRASAKHGGRPF